MVDSKLIVLVCSDLAKGLAAAQAGHAVAEYCLSVKNRTWNNETLVILRCDNVEDWAKTAEAVWSEPDMDNRIMAVASTKWEDWEVEYFPLL